MISILNFLFPKKCVGCNKIGNYFCPNCISQIKQTDLVCPFCDRLSVGGVVHPVCKRKYGLDGLWSLGIYQDPLREAIQKLKYRWVTEVAETLVNITIEYWAKNQPFLLDQIKKSQGKDWVIVPVPLHKSRQNWRGFNQSALLAQSLAHKLGLKYQEILTRVKKTKPQVSLKGYERQRNIKNAFALTINDESLTDNYILIDDVWTTGSTLKECCLVLKRRGAKNVWALTLAR